MKEMWSARTVMKRDARDIIKAYYNLNELIEPQILKDRVEALIGTSDRARAVYLCGGTVGTLFLCPRYAFT